MSHAEIFDPPALRKPSGFNHGIRVPAGQILFLAGQTAGSSGPITTDDFVEQFDGALANVLEVLTAAGGKPEHLTALTIFVTDMEAYRSSLKPLGDRYRARMGKHFPTMALVEVKSLLHPRARVEIQSTAVLP